MPQDAEMRPLSDGGISGEPIGYTRAVRVWKDTARRYIARRCQRQPGTGRRTIAWMPGRRDCSFDRCTEDVDDALRPPGLVGVSCIEGHGPLPPQAIPRGCASCVPRERIADTRSHPLLLERDRRKGTNRPQTRRDSPDVIEPGRIGRRERCPCPVLMLNVDADLLVCRGRGARIPAAASGLLCR